MTKKQQQQRHTPQEKQREKERHQNGINVMCVVCGVCVSECTQRIV